MKRNVLNRIHLDLWKSWLKIEAKIEARKERMKSVPEHPPQMFTIVAFGFILSPIRLSSNTLGGDYIYNSSRNNKVINCNESIAWDTIGFHSFECNQLTALTFYVHPLQRNAVCCNEIQLRSVMDVMNEYPNRQEFVMIGKNRATNCALFVEQYIISLNSVNIW